MNVVISIYFIHMELNSKDFFGAQNGAIGHNVLSAQRLVTIFVSLSLNFAILRQSFGERSEYDLTLENPLGRGRPKLRN